MTGKNSKQQQQGQDAYNDMAVTDGKNRYNRISQLAESVFGDSIVQKGKNDAKQSPSLGERGRVSSNVSPSMATRKESNTEGVSSN